MKTVTSIKPIDVVVTMRNIHDKFPQKAWDFVELQTQGEILETADYYFQKVGGKEVRLHKDTNRISTLTNPRNFTKY